MLIVDMPIPKVCITKDGYYGNCPMDRAWCIQENAPSEITVREAYTEMTENIPPWCPIKGELIRCGECKQYEKFDGYCKKFGMLFPKDNPCIDGERKEEEG